MNKNISRQPEEELTPIQGYEGLYSITSFGRVWSHLRIIRVGKNFRTFKGKYLKPGLNRYGYLYVVLCKEGNKNKTIRLHRLVAIHYIENSYNLPQVNHLDGNKLNCRKDNLEWCDDQGNKKHAMENGLIPKLSSIYYGVTFRKGERYKNKPWYTYLRVNKKQIHIGNFKTELEAAKAYNEYITLNNICRPLNILK